MQTEKEKIKFPPLCPDFVVELRSPSDSLKTLRSKMMEYIENGVALGWLIDPIEKKVYIHRQNGEIEILEDPEIISDESLLKGFSIRMDKIWS